MPTHEEIGCYFPGDYHPVHLGDIYDSRFQVEHKLGHGSSATVWLARDQDPRSEHQLVALKIHIAGDSPDYIPQQSSRLSILQELQPSPTSPPELETSPRNYFPRLLHEFVITGPNGTHLCEVMEPLGPMLGTMGDLDLFWPGRFARRTAVELVQAVLELHARGVVHIGM